MKTKAVASLAIVAALVAGMAGGATVFPQTNDVLVDNPIYVDKWNNETVTVYVDRWHNQTVEIPGDTEYVEYGLSVVLIEYDEDDEPVRDAFSGEPLEEGIHYLMYEPEEGDVAFFVSVDNAAKYLSGMKPIVIEVLASDEYEDKDSIPNPVKMAISSNPSLGHKFLIFEVNVTNNLGFDILVWEDDITLVGSDGVTYETSGKWSAIAYPLYIDAGDYDTAFLVFEVPDDVTAGDLVPPEPMDVADVPT